jgi:plastocyanin
MNVRPVFLILALLAACMIAAGCSQYGSLTAPAAKGPEPGAAPYNQLAPALSTVTIVNNSFVPATLSIYPGTKVTWINQDSVRHTVTATGQYTGMFQSQPLGTGDTFTYTFGSYGTFPYTSTIDENMNGQIVVLNEPGGSDWNVGH